MIYDASPRPGHVSASGYKQQCAGSVQDGCSKHVFLANQASVTFPARNKGSREHLPLLTARGGYPSLGASGRTPAGRRSRQDYGPQLPCHGSVVTKRADACMIQGSQAEAPVGNNLGESPWEAGRNWTETHPALVTAVQMVKRALPVWRGTARGTILFR